MAELLHEHLCKIYSLTILLFTLWVLTIVLFQGKIEIEKLWTNFATSFPLCHKTAPPGAQRSIFACSLYQYNQAIIIVVGVFSTLCGFVKVSSSWAIQALVLCIIIAVQEWKIFADVVNITSFCPFICNVSCKGYIFLRPPKMGRNFPLWL